MNNSQSKQANTQPYILSETTWKKVKETDYDLVVLPWSATEPHNLHLPYGTDTIETTAIARQAASIAWAKDAKVAVLPIIPFGTNTGQIDLKLTINLNPSTQMLILKDIVRSICMQGFRRFCILNGHGGNDFQQMIRELNLEFPEVFICQVSWFKMAAAQNLFENPGDHADEMETSLMMHIAPQHTLPLSEAGSGATRTFRINAFHEGWARAPRKWTQISTDTGSGDPSKASAEKGKRCFEIITERIAQLFIDLAGTSLNNLYE